MKTIEIKGNDAGQRIDKFLTKTFKNIPVSLIYKNIRKKNIKVNGKRTKPEYKLALGDVLCIYMKDELLTTISSLRDFMKAPSKLEIIYEDKNILLVNKQPGLIVHPDENYHFDSLINRIKHYLFSKKEYNPENELSFTPSLVNRLDRNTGGIVIAAKNAHSLKILNEKMKNREIQKFYLCVVSGIFTRKENVLTAYLKKDENKNKVFSSNNPRPEFKTIKTRYKVLKEINGNSLLEVELLTGRTHQIRAHMAHIGHPIIGDGKYGKKDPKIKYQALLSYKLRFVFDKSRTSDLDYLNRREFFVKCGLNELSNKK